MRAADQWLRIDWDGRARTLPWITRRLQRAGYALLVYGLSRSPSGRGWHGWMRVKPSPRSKAEVIALQLLLGSDPKREARNLYRARQGGPAFAKDWWNVLYRG